MKQQFIQWAEHGWVPDSIIRWGIRRLIQERFDQEKKLHRSQSHKQNTIRALSKGAVAEDVQKANMQHYDVPGDFYQEVLGKNLKYSSAYYEHPTSSLTQAEEAMLSLYQSFAQIKDGMDILELGCGWGSLTLWLASHYPNAKITAISNALSQKHWIDKQCEQRGYQNVTVKTVDINAFSPDQNYDRVVSVEMFEHVRNYKQLFDTINSWLKDDGKLFVHIFCHKMWAYFFETQGHDNWMGQYFFTGGVMPSFDTFEMIDQELSLEEKKWISGTHYQKTARDWRRNLRRNQKVIEIIFENIYPKHESKRWVGRWNMFFMACEELFGFDQGQEWGVGLFRFSKKESIR